MTDNMNRYNMQHCLCGETIVSLANGDKKLLEELKPSDTLLVWDFYAGHLTTAPISVLFKSEPSRVDMTKALFVNEETGDEINLSIVGEHGVFDMDTGKYEYLGNNKSCRMLKDHRFAYLNPDGTICSVILKSLITCEKICRSYSPISDKHICVIANGLITASDAIDGIINCFEVDTKTMRYDATHMLKDIDKYGLFTYEDFTNYCSEDIFESFQLKYLKVAMAKDMITFDVLAWLIVTYIPDKGRLAVTKRA